MYRFNVTGNGKTISFGKELDGKATNTIANARFLALFHGASLVRKIPHRDIWRVYGVNELARKVICYIVKTGK
jgi:hypothetical protein